MPIDTADFRAVFPEFVSAETYPEAQVQFWITAAYAQLSATRFGASLDLAAMLFVAHNLALAAREGAAAKAGGVVGEVRGALTAEAVDKVSMSYSTSTVTDGAGAWNATTYGQRLYAMMRSFGVGLFYIAPTGRSS